MKTEAFFSGEYGNENDTVEMAVKFDSLLSAKLSDIYERVRGETSVASASFR